MSTLAELIDSKRGDLSNRQIAERAGVNSGTIDRVIKGKGIPKVETVDKIAHVLNIPIENARQAAGLPTGENEPYSPPSEANLLNRRQRQAIDELIRSFVTKQAGAHNDVQGQASKSTTNTQADSEVGSRTSGSETSVSYIDDYFNKKATSTNWRGVFEELSARAGEVTGHKPFEELAKGEDLTDENTSEKRISNLFVDAYIVAKKRLLIAEVELDGLLKQRINPAAGFAIMLGYIGATRIWIAQMAAMVDNHIDESQDLVKDLVVENETNFDRIAFNLRDIATNRIDETTPRSGEIKQDCERLVNELLASRTYLVEAVSNGDYRSIGLMQDAISTA